MDADSQIPGGKQAVAPVIPKVRLEIANEIMPETVDPVMAQIELLSATAPGTHVELHLRHNAGGSVDKLQELIECLEDSKCVIEITYSRYIMSSAAMLWLYFYVYGVPHVTSVLPRKPGVVMYHRPRRTLGEYYLCFSNEIEPGNPWREILERKFKRFDEVFEAVIAKLYAILQGLKKETHDKHQHQDGIEYKHMLCRLKESYYGNQDCLIPV